MKSAKFIACCFVEVPNDDVFCNYEFKDSAGTVHTVVGKRGDWLYITDRDRILTVNQLIYIKRGYGDCYLLNKIANDVLNSSCVETARSLPGAEF
ncbi:hypothetical protein PSR38_RS16640 [Escherichia coli]|nr:hypothetical protein [Escherichia coli]